MFLIVKLKDELIRKRTLIFTVYTRCVRPYFTDATEPLKRTYEKL